MYAFPIRFQKLCLSCCIQGVVRIQHHTGKVVKQTEKLTVTFVAEKQSGRPNLGVSSHSLKWLSISELKGLSSFVLDSPASLLVQSVHSGAAVYPVTLVECLDMQGFKRGYVNYVCLSRSPKVNPYVFRKASVKPCTHKYTCVLCHAVWGG